MKRVLFGSAYKAVKPVEREWRAQLRQHNSRPPANQHVQRVKSLLSVVHSTCFAPKDTAGRRAHIRGLPRKLPHTALSHKLSFSRLSPREKERCCTALKKALGACHRMRLDVRGAGKDLRMCYDLAYRYVAFVDDGKHACKVMQDRVRLGLQKGSPEGMRAALASLAYATEEQLEEWHRLSGRFSSCRPVGAFVIPRQLVGVADLRLYFVLAWMLEKLGLQNIDLNTYNTVLAVLVSKRVPLEYTMHMVEEMHKLRSHVRPDATSYALLLQSALDAKALDSAVEVVVRAPVGDQVKDHKFFPALLRGIRGETVASKFALMKSSALMEGVPAYSHTKERLFAVLELYFRGLTCPGQKKLAQDGISETLDTIFAREDIIQSLRPMEVATVVRSVSAVKDEAIGPYLARFVKMLHAEQIAGMNPALLSSIVHEASRALKANVDGRSAGALEEEVVQELTRLATKIAEDAQTTKGISRSTKRAIENSMLLVLGTQQSLQAAKDTFATIEAPNTTSFNNMIWLYGVVAREREEAIRLVGEMQSAGVQPDARTLGTIAHVFAATTKENDSAGFSEAVAYIVSLSEMYNINVYASTIHRINEHILDPVAREQLSESLKRMRSLANRPKFSDIKISAV